MRFAPLFPLALLALTACPDVTDPDEENPEEVITTVVLTLTPAEGDAIEVSWADPENDGSPVIDDLVLEAGVTYGVTVSFLNELEDPAEDVTEEVDAEADEHQVFYTGTAMDLVTYTYDDTDDQGFPLGLSGTLVANTAGTGDLVVTLRHLPPQDGEPVKTATLADDVAEGGLSSIPGESDASVTFPVTVGAAM